MANTVVSENRNYRYYINKPLGLLKYKLYLRNKRKNSDRAIEALKFYDSLGNNGLKVFFKRNFTPKGIRTKAYEREVFRDLKSINKFRDLRYKMRNLY